MHDKLFFVHANECQIVQIENSCDKILGLGFDLGHLNMNTYCVEWNPFGKGL
jgi:hypothetical protein